MTSCNYQVTITHKCIGCGICQHVYPISNFYREDNEAKQTFQKKNKIIIVESEYNFTNNNLLNNMKLEDFKNIFK